MSEPLPSETAVVAYERTAKRIDDLQAYEPKTDAERRRCASELIKLRQGLIDLAKEVIATNAAEKVAEVIGSEYTKPTDAARMNGNGNGHDWAPIIAGMELCFEKKLAALKEELAGKESSGLRQSDLKVLARGLIPFLDEQLAATAAPLIERIAELEATATRYEGVWEEQRVFSPNMMVTYGGNLWICEEANSNARPGQSDVWRLMAKTKARR